MNDFIAWAPAGLWPLLILTILLGGAAAWVTGQTVAETWKPYWQLVWYMALLAAAVRFFHYALFHEPLLDPVHYTASTAYLMLVAALGHRAARHRQMREQYGWHRNVG